jgi:hypothetical protein
VPLKIAGLLVGLNTNQHKSFWRNFAPADETHHGHDHFGTATHKDNKNLAFGSKSKRLAWEQFFIDSTGCETLGLPHNPCTAFAPSCRLQNQGGCFRAVATLADIHDKGYGEGAGDGNGRQIHCCAEPELSSGQRIHNKK